MREIDSAQRYIDQNKVVDLYLDGRRETAIAKQLGFDLATVKDHIENFKEIAKNDSVLMARGQEVVHEYDIQTGHILAEFSDLIEDAKNNSDLRTWNGALKNKADVQAKRVEVLQRAGLINESAVMDQVKESEEKIAVLLGIIRNIMCDDCKIKTMAEIRKVTGKEETVVIVPHG